MYTREEWDARAADFDAEPDHGLGDPVVRGAWSHLLLPLLPPVPASVADIGCGTGSLAVLLAQAGYRVSGVDFAPAMVEAARAKATAAGAGTAAGFVTGDACRPPWAAGSFDVVLARHVLWALPEPAAVLRRWLGLLRPAGRLVLVEGRWSSGGGLTAAEATRLVLQHRREAAVTALQDARLWGRPVSDERYLVLSTR